MKVFGIVVKVVLALAAVAGAIYVAVVYGDKIVAWAKKKLSACKCCCGGECEYEGDCTCEGECECECECAEEEPAEVIEPTADEVVAAETDFEG